jgi:sugar O-acyltransferase (sialic acid O-acetyltransferase NeuD family)
MRLVLIGGGRHAKEVADVAVAAGHEVIGYVAAAAAGPSLRYCGTFDWLVSQRQSFDSAIIAFGALNRHGIRQRVAVIAQLESRDVPFATLVSPVARVAESAILEAGAYVGHGAIVNAEARIGRHVIINTGAIINHDVCVGDGSIIAPAACLAGGARVGARSLVGLGARVLQDVSIGSDALLGAGVTLFENMDDGAKELHDQFRRPRA